MQNYLKNNIYWDVENNVPVIKNDNTNEKNTATPFGVDGLCVMFHGFKPMFPAYM